MRVRVGCQFDLQTDGTVPLIVLVEPHPGGDHKIIASLRQVDPVTPVREYLDRFGNRCWRLVMPGGPLTLRYDAIVEVSGEPDPRPAGLPLVPVADLPDETLAYLLPSRSIQSDLMMDAAWSLFGATEPTAARIQAICDWVHENIRYETGSSDRTGTALDTFTRRVGVCRDIALVSVALCRAMNIPARYAYGYLPDIDISGPYTPMDFHAWFNAFLDGRWYTFDARYNVPRIGRIEIAHGPDAVDVAMTTTFGPNNLNSLVVWSDQVDDDAAESALMRQEAER